MKNVDKQYQRIVGKNTKVDLGLVVTQLIAIESRLQALSEFVIKKATKEEKISFYKSVSDHSKEMEIMIYNLYKDTNESETK